MPQLNIGHGSMHIIICMNLSEPTIINSYCKLKNRVDIQIKKWHIAIGQSGLDIVYYAIYVYVCTGMFGMLLMIVNYRNAWNVD